MSTLQEIQQPIAEEIRIFEATFRAAMHSENKLLNRITQYIIRRKGKQMRPMFVLLTGKLFGEITPSCYTAASLIELLHTATLVHDDVVDDARMRRGFFSVNALWKNKIAVLVGDYLLSRGLLLSVEKNEFQLLQIISTAVKEMSEGELLQQEKSRLLNITESVYFDIIRQKTGSLIGACCAAGGAASGVSTEQIERLKDFGLAAGIAFQIKDDLLDYGFGKNIGKATGVDIQERKMTLPLIFALNRSDRTMKRRMMATLKHHNTQSTRVKELIHLVRESGGVEYAAKKMEDYRDKALALLYTFPENDARHALEQLVHYTINRDK